MLAPGVRSETYFQFSRWIHRSKVLQSVTNETDFKLNIYPICYVKITFLSSVLLYWEPVCSITWVNIMGNILL